MLESQVQIVKEDEWQQQWLKAGGFAFLVYQVDFVAAFEAARKASIQNRPSASELVLLDGLLRGQHGSLWRLQSSYQIMMIQSVVTAPLWVQQIYANEVDIQHLVDLVCRVELASASEGLTSKHHARTSFLTQLLQTPFSGHPALANLQPQARRCLQRAEPDGLLLRALRKSWLGTAPGGSPSRFAPGLKLTVEQMQAQMCKSDPMMPGYDPKCMFVLRDLLMGCQELGTFPCLVQGWGTEQPRAPKLMLTLRDTIVNAAAWTPPKGGMGVPADERTHFVANEASQAQILSDGLQCMYMLAHKDGSLPDWVDGSQPAVVDREKALQTTFHDPSLALLMQRGAPILVEAILRATARCHQDWIDRLNQQYCASIQSMAGGSHGQPHGGPGHPTGNLVGAGKPSQNPERGGGARQWGGTGHWRAGGARHDRRQEPAGSMLRPSHVHPLRPRAGGDLHSSMHVDAQAQDTTWMVVQSHIAAWLLPVILRRVKDEPTFDQGASFVAWLVGLLTVNASLGDATAGLVCKGLADLLHCRVLLQGSARTPSAESAATARRAVLCALGIVSDLINRPVPPGCNLTARRRAVVQSGLLAQLSKLACLWWAEEDRPASFGLLARAVLPSLAALLPSDAHLGSKLKAVTSCFEGVAVSQLPELAGMAAYAASLGHPQETRDSSTLTASEAAKAATLSALPGLVEALEAHCGPADRREAGAGLERSRMAALGPGCHNPDCQNLAGACEAELPARKCSNCKKTRYCSPACQKAAWRTHKRACKKK
ncbi:hypothetical protein WJX72_003027 [[Myrmecia] bisecta]|uniref:MYND-type domain-containing protein n=1 Tax=[Myrmecia] bisecta TaxID=41462 RepID=A0AAW1PJE1_9CHLO